jgi:predicted AlkP superfamily phosphohydrolase/phosphomutase/tetratricopeptide (TPR) repeat protein
MTTARKLLLVGWDAADWEVIRPLLDGGQMPNLSRLIDSGVCGNLATLYPALSPMLWTSIATGKRAGKHGIYGFYEPGPSGEGVRPISSLSRTSKAVWNILNQSGKRSVVVGWWPSHPAEPIEGVMVSDMFQKVGSGPDIPPMLPGTVHPESWNDRMAELRIVPMELPGEVIRFFVPEYDRVDQKEDRRIHSLARLIAETMTVHAAATEALEHADWDFAAVYYDGIDHFSHGYMQYHPPRLPWIGEEDFSIYSQIVSRAYRYHDAMLGRLLHFAGPDATVVLVSDHGFHSSEGRPARIPAEPAGPAVAHRHFGMICLSGPGVRKDERLYGSVLLDVTPTILHLFGLPVGEDMDGKVLVNALEEPGKIETVPTWDSIDGPSGQHAPGSRLNPAHAAEAMRQLVALGYVAPPPNDRQKQIDECMTELDYNLARSYDDENRPDLSIPIYRRILAGNPEDHRAVSHLFNALLRIGRLDEARTQLDEFDAICERRTPEAREELERRMAEKPSEELKPGLNDKDDREAHERNRLREVATGHVTERALNRFLFASQTGGRSEVQRAFEQLEKACEETGAAMPALLVASRLARTGDAAGAMELARRALEADPDSWQAHALMARLHLKAKRREEAMESAARSLALVFFQPQLHYVSACALIGLRDFEAAEQPLRIAVAQSPGFRQAHEMLWRLYSGPLNRPDAATYHFVRSQELRKRVGKRAEAPPAEAASRPQFALRKAERPVDRERDVVIVTGLPRSGTSMLMQMLAAGGIDPLTDGLRAADEDNPRGYFEFEPATRLREDASWLPSARGRVVKLVLPLVPYLPADERYMLVIVQRNLTEVLASQRKMLERLSREERAARLTEQVLMREYCAQEQRVQSWLEAHPEIAMLPLDYGVVVNDPRRAAGQISEFLDGRFDASAAAGAVEPSLKRQGTAAGGAPD